MSVNSAFDDYQRTIDEDPKVLATARERREAFKKAFKSEPDVIEVWSSGSLRRSTQLKPINDLDLVVVYKQLDQPTWGAPGRSAEDALGHVGSRVNALLGFTSGSSSRLVRLAKTGDHAVKCFIDAPDSGFTVDVMPALRQSNGELLIPEVHSRDWIRANPEYLIHAVAAPKSDVAVVVALTQDAQADVHAYVKEHNIGGAIITLAPTGEPGQGSISDGAHARTWARSARELLRRELRALPSTAGRLHLFLAAPAGAALFLGHDWNLLPTTLVYAHTGASYAPTLLVS